MKNMNFTSRIWTLPSNGNIKKVYRKIQAGRWEVTDYVEFFKRGLGQADLSLDGQGESVLTELLERHADEMN